MRLSWEDSALSDLVKRQRQEEVIKVVHYCRDIARCRRVQVLEYFDQVLSENQCNRTCDVCADPDDIISKDVTAEAVDIVKLVTTMRGNNTSRMVKKTFRGHKERGMITKGHTCLPEHGKGMDMDPQVMDQLFEALVVMDILREVSVKNVGRYPDNLYLKVRDKLCFDILPC